MPGSWNWESRCRHKDRRLVWGCFVSAAQGTRGPQISRSPLDRTKCTLPNTVSLSPAWMCSCDQLSPPKAVLNRFSQTPKEQKVPDRHSPLSSPMALSRGRCEGTFKPWVTPMSSPFPTPTPGCSCGCSPSPVVQSGRAAVRSCPLGPGVRVCQWDQQRGHVGGKPSHGLTAQEQKEYLVSK